LKLWRPWRRRAPAASDPTALPFDASIDIGERRAAEMVRRRLLAVPGAGWISVEAHDGAALSIRLFPAGSGVEGEGPVFSELRRVVEREVWEALEAVRAEARGAANAWVVEAPMQAGFAETLAPSAFNALEELAKLARMSREIEPEMLVPEPVAPPPVPIVVPIVVPPEDVEDVGRLSRLLALVLPAEATQTDATRTAASAVRRFGCYAAVLAAPEAELRNVPGLGTHCVAAIKLIHAAAVRHARAAIAARPVLADRQKLNDYLAAALARERIEQFRILFLDERGMLRADEVQATGTVNHTPVYPREVVRRALALEAKAVVLVHNHPSGDPSPSREDIEMTRQVREAASVMNIGLRDHIIVGNGRWLSFRDEGYLD